MITSNPIVNSDNQALNSANTAVTTDLVASFKFCNLTNPFDKVFFFDIDNCLYDIDTGISDMMAQRIVEYGLSVGIPEEEVSEITFKYYQQYGLAIRGMIKHHDVDPIDFDRKVDQALPLESILQPNLELRSMLMKIKMKRWAFTNANFPHAARVLKLLGIDDLFHGITYCDYGQPNFACKPEIPTYLQAMRDAQITNPLQCYFIDDSIKNLDTAKKLGWTTILVSGTRSTITVTSQNHHVITKVTDLPQVLPELFNYAL